MKCTDHKGIAYPTLTAMCNAYGITSSAYHRRLERGMSQYDALTKPLRYNNSKHKKNTGKNKSIKDIVFPDTFSPKSKYPSEEYARYLKWRISILKQELPHLNKDAQKTVEEEIRKLRLTLISMPMQYLRAADLVMLGEDELLHTLHTPLVQDRAREMVKHPDMLMQGIIIFNKKYKVTEGADVRH